MPFFASFTLWCRFFSLTLQQQLKRENSSEAVKNAKNGISYQTFICCN